MSRAIKTRYLMYFYQYRIVTMAKGFVASNNVDSLSAFWAGLQVLAGDVQNAIKSHLFCMYLCLQIIKADRTLDWNLWRKYHAIPELFDTSTYKPVVASYPLRPGIFLIIIHDTYS